MHVEFFADTSLLSGRFAELVNRADDIEIAVAWAGKPEEGMQELLWTMRTKLRKLVVGCSLHNTNPNFLERWQGHPGFRVVLDTTEVFHPKLYLFRVGTEFHLFVGSSNLTGGGFEKTREANVLLHGSEMGPIGDAAAYIEERYKEGTKPHGKVWAQWLAAYRIAWQKKQNFASSIQPRSASSPPNGRKMQGLGEWSFAEYFELLKAGNPLTKYTLANWLDFLERVRKRWSIAEWSLERMPVQDRRLVASTAKEPGVDAGVFGSVGLGYFLHAVIGDPAPIDRALRCIPREGPLEDRHWIQFEGIYSAAFPKAATGTASRLLCMWRPDAFFSANSGSVPEIATQFGLSQSSLRTWDGYWEASKWIRARPWARGPKPQGELAERCWHGRVALLDVLMYREP
jgi:HKD family nuclease